VIEARPTLGQISPSEAAWALRGQTARRLNDRWCHFGKRPRTHCAQSGTCSRQRRQNGGRTGSVRVFTATPTLPLREQTLECGPRRSPVNVMTRTPRQPLRARSRRSEAVTAMGLSDGMLDGRPQRRHTEALEVDARADIPSLMAVGPVSLSKELGKVSRCAEVVNCKRTYKA
jgi:hypothetical protein